MLHNVLEPLIQKEHDYVKLTVQGYDVVEKREYPSSKDLENIDCVCISGSFVEDAYKDAPWISRLCGFVRLSRAFISVDLTCFIDGLPARSASVGILSVYHT
jgi:hypothetical protein